MGVVFLFLMVFFALLGWGWGSCLLPRFRKVTSPRQKEPGLLLRNQGGRELSRCQVSYHTARFAFLPGSCNLGPIGCSPSPLAFTLVPRDCWRDLSRPASLLAASTTSRVGEPPRLWRRSFDLVSPWLYRSDNPLSATSHFLHRGHGSGYFAFTILSVSGRRVWGKITLSDLLLLLISQILSV